MSPWQRSLTAAALGGAAWWLAAWFSGSLSEGFYLAVPLAALTYALVGCRDVRSRLRSGAAVAAALLLFGVLLGGIFVGPPALLSWHFWLEVATALYFLAAIVLVLFTLRRLLLAAGAALHARGHLPEWTRVAVCEAVPFALFVALALPYGMAFGHVHRFKMPNLADPKSALGRDFEDVEFAADGTQLRGWWIPAKAPSERTLIICHGIAANRTIFLPFTEIGDWLDANILMFDLRGHGDSGGHTTTIGCLERDDVLAAINYVRREKPAESRKVIGMGVSLGAASLARGAAAAEPPLDAVILDGCFTSTADMTHAAVGLFPPPVQHGLLAIGLPLADLHAGCPMMQSSAEETIDRLRAPAVFLHSRGDPLIPSDHARRLHHRAAGPKRLCVFDLDGHCDGFFARRELYRANVAWVETYLTDHGAVSSPGTPNSVSIGIK